MAPRGRSVPAPAAPPTDSSNSITASAAILPSPPSNLQNGNAASTPAKASSTGSNGGPKLLAQADALARMTIELNLRAVSAQAERLEKDLRELVMCTAQDKEFRERHEKRLQDMWREILVVKKRMEEVRGEEGDCKAEVESCRENTTQSIEELRQEMGELKGLVSDMSSTLDQLPTLAEAESLINLETPQTSIPRKLDGSKLAKKASQKSRYWPDSQVTTPKQRIREALNSTRRWNRDHKTTPLNDAIFAANYLKQQSKRDPPIAVYIQRAIQRHIHRSGRGKTKARPENLEQFCQDVTWRDVIEAVEAALVRDEDGAMMALGK